MASDQTICCVTGSSYGDGHLAAVHARHHQIEEDQVGTLLRHNDECLLAAGRHAELIALGREHDLQQCPVADLVIDDENARRPVVDVGDWNHRRVDGLATLTQRTMGRELRPAGECKERAR